MMVTVAQYGTFQTPGSSTGLPAAFGACSRKKSELESYLIKAATRERTLESNLTDADLKAWDFHKSLFGEEARIRWCEKKPDWFPTYRDLVELFSNADRADIFKMFRNVPEEVLKHPTSEQSRHLEDIQKIAGAAEAVQAFSEFDGRLQVSTELCAIDSLWGPQLSRVFVPISGISFSFQRGSQLDPEISSQVTTMAMFPDLLIKYANRIVVLGKDSIEHQNDFLKLVAQSIAILYKTIKSNGLPANPHTLALLLVLNVGTKQEVMVMSPVREPDQTVHFFLTLGSRACVAEPSVEFALHEISLFVVRDILLTRIKFEFRAQFLLAPLKVTSFSSSKSGKTSIPASDSSGQSDALQHSIDDALSLMNSTLKQTTYRLKSDSIQIIQPASETEPNLLFRCSLSDGREIVVKYTDNPGITESMCKAIVPMAQLSREPIPICPRLAKRHQDQAISTPPSSSKKHLSGAKLNVLFLASKRGTCFVGFETTGAELAFSEAIHRDPSLLVPFLQQSTEAICRLQQLRMIHRDIKPGNFVWDSVQQRWLLVDLDALYKLSLDQQEGPADDIGTGDFRSPEMRQLQPCGPPTDIYSWGVMVEEIFRMIESKGVALPAAFRKEEWLEASFRARALNPADRPKHQELQGLLALQ